MSVEVEKFLRAEAASLKILESIKALDNEIKQYKQVTDDLQEIKAQLVPFVTQLNALTLDSQEVMTAIKSVGGLAIADKVEELGGDLRSFESSFTSQSQDLNKNMSELLNQVRQIDSAVTENGKVTAAVLSSQFATVHNGMGNLVGAVGESKKEQLSETDRMIKNALEEMDQRLKHLEDGVLKQVKTYALGAVGLSMVTIAILVKVLMK